MHRRIPCALVLLALVLGLCAPPALAQAPVRVMFVGDCHSWFLDTYFPKLAASGDPAISVVKPGLCIRGGWTLEQIWKQGGYLCPDVKTLKAGEGRWDFGLIDIGYACKAPNATHFSDWMPKFDEVFKQAGAKTVITAPWPDQHDVDTIAEYMAVADGLASQLGARVAPVGLAVDSVRRERPGLIEYVDENHVNAPGWYLQMCVLYATLFDRSPEGLDYRMGDIPAGSGEAVLWDLPAGWALSDADAVYLQRVAWETVQEHQAQK
jgi:hypothetical protein